MNEELTIPYSKGCDRGHQRELWKHKGGPRPKCKRWEGRRFLEEELTFPEGYIRLSQNTVFRGEKQHVQTHRGKKKNVCPPNATGKAYLPKGTNLRTKASFANSEPFPRVYQKRINFETFLPLQYEALPQQI